MSRPRPRRNEEVGTRGEDHGPDDDVCWARRPSCCWSSDGCASNSSTTPPAAGSSTAASASSSPCIGQWCRPLGSASSGAASSAAASGIAQFEGITFVATEVTGAHTIVPGSTITLTFERGPLSARAGCNSMFGQYTITGGVLNAPQLASTLMACDDALMAQDTWLAAFLASSPTWTYAGRHPDPHQRHRHHRDDQGTQRRRGAGGDRLEAGRAELKTATANTTTAVDPTLTAWIRFNGSEVAYNTSCNLGGGSAQIGRRHHHLRRAAQHADLLRRRQRQTETAMNAVLQGTTTYTITDDPSGALLTITSQDGASGLQFVADPTVGADAFATGRRPPARRRRRPADGDRRSAGP